MKTTLDQISIPPLCGGMSELGHTLVGKQCLCNWEVLGSNPSEASLQGCMQGQGHHGETFVFVSFAFSFAVTLSPMSLGILENAGVM